MLNGPVVSRLAVEGNVIAVTLILAVVVDHVGVEGVVELVVVSASSEVVVAGKGSVTLELVVAVETKLWSKARSSSPGGGIAAEGELGGDRVTVKADTEDGKQDCEVVAYTVDVLLGVGEFSEGDNAVTREKPVVGSRV